MVHLKQDIILGKHKVKWNVTYQHNDRKEIASTISRKPFILGDLTIMI